MRTVLHHMAEIVRRVRAHQLRRQRFQRVLSRQFNWRAQRHEQLEGRILLSADFGDAPTAVQSGFASSYPTTLADNGARHTATGPLLGASRGADLDGQPSVAADGDDNDGDDDEDGVRFVPGFLTPGDSASTVEIDMTASPSGGLLNAWVDFNADGDWADAGEQIFADTTLSSGVIHTLTFAVPAEAAAGATYARFRVASYDEFSEGPLSFDGPAADGEVEDYRITVTMPPDSHGLFPGEQFPVGINPNSVAAGDLNGDTYMDLVVSNRLSHDVSVLLGLGDGTFLPPTNYAAGRQPSDVEVADLNGDGFMDVVVTSAMDDDVSVLLGRGDGTLATRVYYDVGDTPRSVALSDLNGDGRVDIVVANRIDHNVSVLLGAGDGTFASELTFLVGTTPYGARPVSVAVADLNGDSYPDIVTANDLSDDVSVLFGLGNGTFTTYQAYPVGADPVSVALADFNGDNHVDIVAASAMESNVSVLLSAGDGTFAAEVTYDVGGSAHAMSVSDVDHDSQADLLVVHSDKHVAVMLGLGDGTFAPKANYYVANIPNYVLPVDIDGDSHIDIVTADDGNHTVTVLLGYGDGTFPLRETDTVGERPYAVAVADLNGDGPTDVVAVNRNSHNVSVLIGLGNGTYAPQVTYPVGTNPSGVTLGDLNGDNYVDIVATNSQSDDVSVLLGLGDGTFTPHMTYDTRSGPYSVALADLNGDAIPDIVAANVQQNGVSVLLGVGDGTFQEQVLFDVGFSPYSVALDDLNGDGHIDIVTANQAEDTVSVLLGDGDGTFAAQTKFSVGDQPYSLALADLNGDDHVDIVTANLWTDNVSVLLGIGDGTFASQATYGAGHSPIHVVLGDVNGDGHPDVAVANYNSNNLSVLLGIGDGTLAQQARYTTGGSPNGLAIAELNTLAYGAASSGVPGFADLVAVNSANDNVSVLLNRLAVTPDPAVVVGRHIFYNNSSWDGGDVGANAADDSAIAPDKQPLMAGQKATVANYTSFSRGINGIMIDVAQLANPNALSVDDFEFRVGNDGSPGQWPSLGLDPSEILVDVREGAGSNDSHRVTILFPDGAIQGAWLQVTVKASNATGLAAPDVHYWGNAVGETGDVVGDTLVDAYDVAGARDNPHASGDPATVTDQYDFNRDTLVDEVDQWLAADHQTDPNTSLHRLDLRQEELSTVIIDVSPTSTTEDGATNLAYTLARSGSLTEAATVSFRVTGTAEFASDYTVSGAASFDGTVGTANFAPGSATAELILDPVADGNVELDETAWLVLLNGETYTVGTPANASGTITNDDSLQVSQTTINDGSAGRSLVTSLTIAFNAVVDIQPDAFEVVHRGKQEQVLTSFTTEIVDNKTVVTITFLAGPSVVTRAAGNTLADGNYTLTIDHAKVAYSGLLLDGDEDGTAGGDYVFGDALVDNFFRFYGDRDGDRDVDLTDFAYFRRTYGKGVGDTSFDPQFDYDGDGDVDLTDFAYFRRNYGKLLAFQ